MKPVYYPIFLNLRGKEVLVVGAGKVALRKVQGLLEAGAKVTVISPHMDPGFSELPVKWKKRRFRKSDVTNQTLVFAATNEGAANRRIAAAAAAKGIFANIADSVQECTFLVPSRIRRGNLQVAISTGGQSPRLAIAIRQSIEAALEKFSSD